MVRTNILYEYETLKLWYFASLRIRINPIRFISFSSKHKNANCFSFQYSLPAPNNVYILHNWKKYKRNIKLKILKYALAEDHLIKTNSRDKLKKFKSFVTSPTELHIKRKIARRDSLDTFKKLESYKNDVWKS